MKVKIIVVGKLKEKYLQAAEAEYMKRLRPYAKVEIIEVKERTGKEGVSENELKDLMHQEWNDVKRYINDTDTVWCLDVHGEIVSSEMLSEKMQTWKTWESSQSQLVFVIGGPAGLDDHLRKRAKWLWSMSKLTFTHQFVRVILLEQIYRAEKIMRKEPYHK
ncbi:MAG: 23S rRNA (pseudouridine(1915)-N(3))-methyltransferase RlmH [Culicoidibacterales bacterium]